VNLSQNQEDKLVQLRMLQRVLYTTAAAATYYVSYSNNGVMWILLRSYVESFGNYVDRYVILISVIYCAD
jgi:hypothetical protein